MQVQHPTICGKSTSGKTYKPHQHEVQAGTSCDVRLFVCLAVCLSVTSNTTWQVGAYCVDPSNLVLSNIIC